MAAKLATPNRFEALAAATEEQKTFDPPTAISTSEEIPSALHHRNLKDDIHILRVSTDQNFEGIDKDMKNIGFVLTGIKTTQESHEWRFETERESQCEIFKKS